MRPHTLVSAALLLVGAVTTAVLAQPRPPVRRPPVRHADGGVHGDASAQGDGGGPASAMDGGVSAVTTDGGVVLGDVAIPMRQTGEGTVIHFPVPEQLARTAVPVFAQVRSSAPIDHVSLFYRGVGARRYTEVRMSAMGQQFHLASGYGAQIPCDDIFPPRVEYYVNAYDSSGAPNGHAGAADAPIQLPIVERRSYPAPTLPGQPPPRTCGGLAVAPTARDAGAGRDVVVRGNADLGEPCQSTNDCRNGLRCGATHTCVFDRPN